MLRALLAIVAAKFKETENFQKVYGEIQNNDDQEQKGKFIEKTPRNMEVRKVLKFFKQGVQHHPKQFSKNGTDNLLDLLRENYKQTKNTEFFQ